MRRGWRGRFGSTRLLPLAIGGMAALLVVKLAMVTQGVGASAALAVAGRAVVPAARAAGGEHAGGAARGGAAAPAGAVVAGSAGAGSAGGAARAGAVEAAGAVAPGPSAAEVAAAEAERALLQDLRARRTVLDGRAQALDAREAVLAATERRLGERVEQLAAVQARLEALEQTRRERDEANWRGLVKTYESMRPRDAAAIFNELEQPVLMQMLDRMKEAKAAQVLAAMQPERARAATAQLAQWRVRGGPQG